MVPGTLDQVALVEILRRVEPRLRDVHIEASTSLVDDLAMDSMRLADLSAAIEAALGETDVPLTDWLDAETERLRPRFSVHSLVQFIALLTGTREM